MKKILITLALLLSVTASNTLLAASAFFTVTVSGANITITPTTSFTYTTAGIKVNTSGFSVSNVGVDCTLLSNDYCSFSASQSSPKTLTISGTGAFNATLCLQAEGQLQCQNFTITTTSTSSLCTTADPVCLVMISKNLVDGAMNVTTPSGAPDVSSCTQSGVDKADCICGIEGRAVNGGLGTWKAWLGLTTVGNPRERLDDLYGAPAFPASSSWVSQETGETIYSTWGALGNDISTYADASNPISTSTTPVHTGGWNNSGVSPSSAWAWTCDNWTSTSGSVDPGNPNGLNASSNAADSWNDSGGASCATASPIYCTEVQP